MKPPPLSALPACLACGLWLLASGCGKPTSTGSTGPAAHSNSTSSPAPATAVAVASPTRGPITRTITLPATLRAFQQATLHAKVSGYLKSITVDRGDAVRAGDTLAEIEAPELAADLAKAQAEVALATVEHLRLTEAAHKAPDLVVPLAIDIAKAKLDAAVANRGRIETLLAFTHITAPFAGIVTRRWADPGALIPAPTTGSPTSAAALVTLADFSRVRVEVAIPEADAPLLKPGTEAEVSVEELAGRKFPGQVTRIAWALDESTRTMPVEIELPNPDAALRPGMFATARLGVARKPDALLLPAAALVTEKTRTSVFVEDHGHARKTAVKVGFEDGRSFEILDGLTAEQTVILTGSIPLSDGQAVTRKEAK